MGRLRGRKVRLRRQNESFSRRLCGPIYNFKLIPENCGKIADIYFDIIALIYYIILVSRVVRLLRVFEFTSSSPHPQKDRFLVVQTIKETFRPKGYMMSTHKTGLHKDVARIFEGVWNPEVDNIQPTFNESAPDGDAYVKLGQFAYNDWPKKARIATIAKVFVKAPGNIFSSKRRRERKRLLSISKHLLINIPS